jgi:hypothetical protein
MRPPSSHVDEVLHIRKARRYTATKIVLAGEA